MADGEGREQPRDSVVFLEIRKHMAPLFGVAEAEIASTYKKARRTASSRVAYVAREAYIRGLADGYAQVAKGTED